MPRFTRTLTAAALAVVLAGCASAGGRAHSAPEMLSRTHPDLQLSTAPTSARMPFKVTVKVLVDSTGRPDMRTFEATGRGVEENRDALREWIAGTRFRPARKNGRPVAAVFTTTIGARVERRVMR